MVIVADGRLPGYARYADRAAAGEALAQQILRDYPELVVGQGSEPGFGSPVVLALPRGGIPVASPVAHALGVRLSVLVVRKLGAPSQPELAVGALAAIGNDVVRVLNAGMIDRIGLSAARLAVIEQAETKVLLSRVGLFGPAPPVVGRIVVIVDDGLATGATMRAAVTAVRQAGAKVVIAAAPVGAAEACRDLENLADRVVCLRTPDPFRAVGEHYRDFEQVTDSEVVDLLR